MTSPSAKGPHGFVPVTEPVRAHPQRVPGRSHEKPVVPRGRAFSPVPVALLAAAYFGAAQVGLSLAFVAEQVTAVWPPTGIALAALLLFGSRAWPGITLGAQSFTRSERAAALGVRPPAIRGLVRRHGLAAAGEGRARRFPRETAEALRERLSLGASVQTVNGYPSFPGRRAGAGGAGVRLSGPYILAALREGG